MEVALRRLAVFYSHLRPVSVADSHRVCASACSSSSIGDELNQTRVSDEEEANLEDGCVFCRVVRGESPAYKVNPVVLNLFAPKRAFLFF